MHQRMVSRVGLLLLLLLALDRGIAVSNAVEVHQRLERQLSSAHRYIRSHHHRSSYSYSSGYTSSSDPVVNMVILCIIALPICLLIGFLAAVIYFGTSLLEAPAIHHHHHHKHLPHGVHHRKHHAANTTDFSVLLATDAAQASVLNGITDWFKTIPPALKDTLYDSYINPATNLLLESVDDDVFAFLKYFKSINADKTFPQDLLPKNSFQAGVIPPVALTTKPLAVLQNALKLDDMKKGAGTLFLSKVANLVKVYGEHNYRAFLADTVSSYQQMGNRAAAASEFLASPADASIQAKYSNLDFSEFFIKSNVAKYATSDAVAAMAKQMATLGDALMGQADSLVAARGASDPSELSHVDNDIVDIALVSDVSKLPDGWDVAGGVMLDQCAKGALQEAEAGSEPVQLNKFDGLSGDDARYLVYRQRGAGFGKVEQAISHVTVVYMSVKADNNKASFSELTTEVTDLLAAGWEIPFLSDLSTPGGTATLTTTMSSGDIKLTTVTTKGALKDVLNQQLPAPLAKAGMWSFLSKSPQRPVLLVKRDPTARPLQGLAFAQGLDFFEEPGRIKRMHDVFYAPCLLTLNPGAANPGTDSLVLLYRRDVSLWSEPVLYMTTPLEDDRSVFQLVPDSDDDTAPYTVLDIWERIGKKCSFSVIDSAGKVTPYTNADDSGKELLVNVPSFRPNVYVISNWNEQDCDSAFEKQENDMEIVTD